MEPEYSHWKKLDKWTLEEAILLLLKREPRHDDSQDMYEIAEHWYSKQGTRYFESRFSEEPMKTIINCICDYLGYAWASENVGKLTIHDVGRISIDPWVNPEEWLEWAQLKELSIPSELNHAPKKSIVWDGFDPESETYPQELDIACIAWRYATKNTQASKTPKQIVVEYLNKNYRSELSSDAIERIATVCNWAKKGGAPKK